MIEYIVIEVNTALGYVKLRINYPDLEPEDIVVDIDSISASENDTELQLVNALNQIVKARYEDLNPRPKQYPPDLMKLKSKTYRV